MFYVNGSTAENSVLFLSPRVSYARLGRRLAYFTFRYAVRFSLRLRNVRVSA